MQGKPATREDAVNLCHQLIAALPRLIAEEQCECGVTKSGCHEWTRAVWRFFDHLANEKGWVLYPRKKPLHKGRAAGEFLLAFTVFDPDRGCRIACESDWGDAPGVNWAFDKLRAIKSDIKVLIFERAHIGEGLPSKLRSTFADYLAKSHHHSAKREFYLLVQFDHGKCRAFIWEPQDTGPVNVEEINFERII